MREGGSIAKSGILNFSRDNANASSTSLPENEHLQFSQDRESEHFLRSSWGNVRHLIPLLIIGSTSLSTVLVTCFSSISLSNTLPKDTTVPSILNTHKSPARTSLEGQANGNPYRRQYCRNALRNSSRMFIVPVTQEWNERH